jgi:alpha-beta hydrolase superfamily lysophospholipase
VSAQERELMTTRSADLVVDVTEAAGLGEPAHVALTVTVPDGVGAEPVVCFAKPGAGYSRGYFTADLPGPERGSPAASAAASASKSASASASRPKAGSQAEWHAARGWIFVSVDHLGVGESSQHPDRLGFGPVVAASEAAEADVLQKLAAGTLIEGLGKVENPVKIGIGQSMGGCLTVVQQGRFHGYDGIGVLGYGVLHTLPPTAPGTPPLVLPWIPRDALPEDGVVTNAPSLARLDSGTGPPPGAMTWGFHYDDVDPAVVARDMDDYPARHGDVPPWGSATLPLPLVLWCVAPGAVLAEAATIEVPVLLAMGERDVLVDPRGELRAFESSLSVDFFVCPRMAHMHNFAGTRELLWRRMETWADWVRASKVTP